MTEKKKAPSSTPQSVEGILDNEHWKFVEEVGLTSIHTKTFPEAYRQQAIRAMQEYANQLVGDKEREITELKRSILSGLKVEGELQSQLLQAQKKVDSVKEQRDEYFEIIKELVELKSMKDSTGKSDIYLKRQPLAWEAAINAIQNKL